jgi:serine/threonine protein kinase
MSTTYEFQVGEPVHINGLNIVCNVEKELGSGTQGKVYSLISSDNSSLALKWYFPSMATNEQYNILESLIQKESPSNRFLWPLALVKTPKKEGFGYIMSMKDSRFKSFSLWLSRKIDPSFKVLLTACFELVQSFHLLHSKGLCYQDLSLNNIYFDPENGEIRIGDTDNIVINGEDKGNVIGTPKFMAPEIIIGKALPNTQTDLYSLAIILFYILFLNHPLEGKLESSIKSLDLPSMSKLYGFKPLFIFDPSDDSNYPDPAFHTNAIIFWNIYPDFVKRIFVRAFTNGIKDPMHGRVRETEWQIALLSLRDSICYCKQCGSENFFVTDSSVFKKLSIPVQLGGSNCNFEDPGRNSAVEEVQSHSVCWNPKCKTTNTHVLNIRIDNRLFVALNHDTKLFLHHIDPDHKYDFSSAVAEVSRHPTEPRVWGLKNLSTYPWKVSKINGDVIEVCLNQSFSLVPGTQIDFGKSKGIVFY